MRIYLSADIEGVAGIAHLPSTGPGRFEYDLGRKWMTEEVVAAIEAVKEMGATEIVVSDGHGSAHNLLLDSLPADVRVVRSWPRPFIQMQGVESGPYEAVILIGHHASNMSQDGILAHTYTLAFRDIKLNDVSQSETSLNALLAAHFNIPVIFSSGDEAYIRHCRDVLGNIETVVTKFPCGYTAASTLMPKAAQKEIHAGVKRAMARRHEIKPLSLPKAYNLSLEFNDRSQPEMWEYLPWVQRGGAYTINVELSDMTEVMKFIAFAAFYQPTGVPTYGFKMS